MPDDDPIDTSRATDRLYDLDRIEPPLPPPGDDEPFEPDPVIEAYKRDVDRTLFRHNLKLTPHQRLEKLQEHVAFIFECRAAGERARRGEHREAGR